ncbi:MAG: transposase [Frankiaceae bacterium]|jgi:transposase|nr:transposase [Frankiaceae bacterium]
MPEKRKKYDRELREGAVRIVEETGKPIAQVAGDLGINEGTLGNWVNQARAEAEGTRGLSKDDREELKRLRAENAELRMERDVLKRSVVLKETSTTWGEPQMSLGLVQRETRASSAKLTLAFCSPCAADCSWESASLSGLSDP